MCSNMRIISGKFKGRRLDPPVTKWPTRPTMDFAREALFNVLQNQIDFESVEVLDLFTGTGSIALEFVSRGCKKVSCVDNFPKAVSYLKKVQKDLQIEAELQIVRNDAIKFLKSTPLSFDLIFCDPPYDYKWYEEIIRIVEERKLINNSGMLILEHDRNQRFENIHSFSSERKYGSSYFSFFSEFEEG